MFFFSCSTYIYKLWICLEHTYILHFWKQLSYKWHNLSSTFVACNANRPHLGYGCIETWTSHFIFQYVKGMSFVNASGPHCPWKVSDPKLRTNLCWSLNELGYPSLRSGKVVEIIDCKAAIVAACTRDLRISYKFQCNIVSYALSCTRHCSKERENINDA